MPNSNPQTNVNISTRLIEDVGLFTTPVDGAKNFSIITCPLNEGAQLEILSISVTSYAAVVDGTDPVTLALKTVSAAGAAGTTLVTAYNLALATAKVTKEVWRGSVVLTAGMSLLGEITVTTPDTAGTGYTLSVESRIIERSGN